MLVTDSWRASLLLLALVAATFVVGALVEQAIKRRQHRKLIERLKQKQEEQKL